MSGLVDSRAVQGSCRAPPGDRPPSLVGAEWHGRNASTLGRPGTTTPCGSVRARTPYVRGEPPDVRRAPHPATGTAALRGGAGPGRARRAAARPGRPARPLGGTGTRVGAGGELVEAQLPAAAEHLGLAADEDGAAEASEAWRLAVDTGLLDVHDPEGDDAGDDAEGTVSAGENLGLLTGGSPQDVLTIWLDGLEAVHADATAPVFDDFADLVGEDGSIDFDSLEWDPEAEAEFLDGVLGNLYLLTVGDGSEGEAPVPLPALAASMIVPDEMGEPTDDILEQVSEAMMRLDDQFRLLEPIGIVAYRPVDETLLVEEERRPSRPPTTRTSAGTAWCG